MPKVKVGFRRLYEALGLRQLGNGPLRFQFTLPEDVDGEAQIGEAPRYGIWRSSAAEYICLDDPISPLGSMEYYGDYKLAKYPCKFFTEIVCTKSVEVEESINSPFQANQPKGHEPVLALAKACERELKSGIDVAAGILGLRVHRQLSMKLVSEDFMAFRENGPHAKSFDGGVSELVDTLGGECRSSEPATMDVRGDPDADVARLALPWLLRAWKTKDPVSKFISLFIPLEVCLEGYGGTVPPEVLERSALIKDLIEKHGQARTAELSQHLASLTKRVQPNLISRFERFAKEAAQPGWEADIRGFKRFYGIRNNIFHRGHQDVRLIVELEPAPSILKEEFDKLDFKQESSHLEDLVERYVSFRLFGDANVYQSRFRPQRPKPPDSDQGSPK